MCAPHRQRCEGRLTGTLMEEWNAIRQTPHPISHDIRAGDQDTAASTSPHGQTTRPNAHTSTLLPGISRERMIHETTCACMHLDQAQKQERSSIGMSNVRLCCCKQDQQQARIRQSWGVTEGLSCAITTEHSSACMLPAGKRRALPTPLQAVLHAIRGMMQDSPCCCNSTGSSAAPPANMCRLAQHASAGLETIETRYHRAEHGLSVARRRQLHARPSDDKFTGSTARRTNLNGNRVRRVGWLRTSVKVAACWNGPSNISWSATFSFSSVSMRVPSFSWSVTSAEPVARIQPWNALRRSGPRFTRPARMHMSG